MSYVLDLMPVYFHSGEQVHEVLFDFHAADELVEFIEEWFERNRPQPKFGLGLLKVVFVVGLEIEQRTILRVSLPDVHVPPVGCKDDAAEYSIRPCGLELLGPAHSVRPDQLLYFVGA